MLYGYGLILDWQAPSMCGGYVNGFAKYFGSNGGNIAISFMAFSEAALIYYMLYGLSYRYLTVRTDPWAIDFFLKPLSFVFLNISGVLFSLGVAISVYSAAAKPEGVGCQLPDVYRDTAKDTIVLNNIILNLLVIVCYLAVWILIKYKKIDVTNKFFTSISMVMLSVISGCAPNRWLASYITAVIMSAADASHAIILYSFSTQYKQAYRRQFKSTRDLIFCKRFQKKMSTNKIVPLSGSHSSNKLFHKSAHNSII
uniref:Uncharacterized protein n=1 Tax=Ditylenchus dipsaci TaxID=166011 RepID=A0A915CMW6_9BILA